MSFIGGIKSKLKKITIRGVLIGALGGAAGQALGGLQDGVTATGTGGNERQSPWLTFALIAGVVFVVFMLARRR